MFRFIHPRQLLCHNTLKCQNKKQYLYDVNLAELGLTLRLIGFDLELNFNFEQLLLTSEIIRYNYGSKLS